MAIVCMQVYPSNISTVILDTSGRAVSKNFKRSWIKWNPCLRVNCSRYVFLYQNVKRMGI